MRTPKIVIGNDAEVIIILRVAKYAEKHSCFYMEFPKKTTELKSHLQSNGFTSRVHGKRDAPHITELLMPL